MENTSALKVILIAAIGENHELGRNNDLLWRLKSDMEFFKQTTSGHWVIMGRKSWESLPPRFRPLPNRVNCIVSRNTSFQAHGAHVFSSIQDALKHAKQASVESVYVIGGAQIYRQALEEGLVDEMYLTHVEARFSDADVFFPQLNFMQWHKNEIARFTAGETNEFNGVIFHYRKV
jgi:dihydrofolate reductase